MKKKLIIPVAIVAGAVAARVIAKRRGKKSSVGYRSSNPNKTASSGPRHARRSARRSRAGG